VGVARKFAYEDPHETRLLSRAFVSGHDFHRLRKNARIAQKLGGPDSQSGPPVCIRVFPQPDSVVPLRTGRISGMAERHTLIQPGNEQSTSLTSLAEKHSLFAKLLIDQTRDQRLQRFARLGQHKILSFFGPIQLETRRQSRDPDLTDGRVPGNNELAAVIERDVKCSSLIFYLEIG
jgi:hypothetical protein